MSQRKEKYSRQLGQRMDTAEKAILGLKLEMLGLLERQDAAQELSVKCSARLKKARQRAAEAECSARLNALALIVIVVAMALLLLAATVMQPEAEEPEAPPGPTPVVRTIPAEPESQEAQLLPWANRLENCTVTYYDICEECCGKADGITYSGAPAVPYETCAVDPAIIPLGSTVLVDYGGGELHCYRAEDIGGGVRGNHVDICVYSHEEAAELGVREATVYWLPAN